MNITTILAIAQIVTPLIFAALAYLSRMWISTLIEKRISPLEKVIDQIHNSIENRNGGSSVRDQFAFIREDIASLAGHFEQHMNEHGNPSLKITRSGAAKKKGITK